MIVHIDLSSGTPPYDQVRSAIETAVAEGHLAPGERLPPVRAMAANLGLAPNTVARAYRELEAVGLLVGHGRRGTFVAEHAVDPTTAAARDAADTYADRVRDLGLGPDVALHLARAALGL